MSLEKPDEYYAREQSAASPTAAATDAAAAVDGSVSADASKQRRAPVSSLDRWILVWLALDALTHCVLEAVFCILSLHGPIAASTSAWAVPWKEYSKADRRWGQADPTILSVELVTAFVEGPMCVLLMYAIVQRRAYRYPLQLVLCVGELYGGWITFAPEWVSGSKNLETSNPVNLIVYLAFANGVWVIIPLLLAAQAWHKLVYAARVSRVDEPAADRVAPLSTGLVALLAGTVVLYVVMMVYVLCFYMDRNQ